MMNAHPVLGAQIIQPVTRLSRELPIIRHHHEWYNGSGYPDRLIGDEIPLLARILHVADAFEAMTAAAPVPDDAADRRAGDRRAAQVRRHPVRSRRSSTRSSRRTGSRASPTPGRTIQAAPDPADRPAREPRATDAAPTAHDRRAPRPPVPGRPSAASTPIAPARGRRAPAESPDADRRRSRSGSCSACCWAARSSASRTSGCGSCRCCSSAVIVRFGTELALGMRPRRRRDAAGPAARPSPTGCCCSRCGRTAGTRASRSPSSASRATRSRSWSTAATCRSGCPPTRPPA